MAAVWKYVTAGTFGGLLVGYSFVHLGGSIASSKTARKRPDPDDSQDSEITAVKELVLPINSIENKIKIEPIFGNSLYVYGLLCALITVGNIRYYQMWRARHSNNRYDADAFLRGFDRFMNEKAYETHKGFRNFSFNL